MRHGFETFSSTFREAYLHRKASGWQRQYEERTRAAKKAKIDDGKAAIRQEDIERGVFSDVQK